MLHLLFDWEYPDWMMMAGSIAKVRGRKIFRNSAALVP
jgi:hypothetical protein